MFGHKSRSILILSGCLGFLAACSGSEVTAPGVPDFVAPDPAPVPAPTPPPTQSDDFDLTGGGCTAGSTQISIGTISTATVCQITVASNGTILSDLSLTGPRTYLISQPTFIGVDDGPTPGASGGTLVDMNIGEGVTIAFQNPTDFLTVNRGSRLIADGAPTAPIVLTSDEDILDDGIANDSQGDASGQWGGLIINGRAPINSCADPSTPATCETSGEGGTGLYGGDNPNDDSGMLEYVRVQYAGFEITTDNELNGIAFQGVGDGTFVDFIQVHNNDDDGVEFFGGTVNVRHVVITGADDDALDWVAGWSGEAQDILVIGSGIGDNGFEGDSNSSNNDITPRSNPFISNFTLIGAPGEDLGMQIREGTAGVFINGIVAGWEDGCLDIDDSSTFGQLDASSTIDIGGTDLQFSSLYFSCALLLADSDGEAITDISQLPGITIGDSTLSGVLPGMNEINIAAIDVATIGGTNLVTENFIGAFEPGLDLTQTWAFVWTVPGTLGISGDPFDPECPESPNVIDVTATSSIPAPASGGLVCQISGVITQDLTLTAFNTYVLNGGVVVGVDEGPDVNAPLLGGIPAVLTLQAGTNIIGENPTDFLVVNRGSQLRSLGTVTAPVVFTSDEDLLGENLGSETGQWGGLIINGRAPINSCSDPSIPATCETSGEGGTGLYGGNDPNDNSGILMFTRVQFAGFEITLDNELNGIAFQGVGDGTVVDFVQVLNNDDDGVEFFGGTVDVSHLVITGVDDDALDWVAGWTGSAQFVIIAGSGIGDNGFEGDSNSSNNDISPRSNPTISNYTLIGSASEDLGMQIREGTAGTFINGVVTGWEDGCLDIDDGATFNQINGSTTLTPNVVDLQMASLFFSCATPFADTANDPVDIAATFSGITTGTSSLTAAPGFTSAFINGANENNVPVIDPTIADPNLETVSQIGALASPTDTWFQGWIFSGSL